MRYYFDTEFAETGSVIDLISIGIISEDGREFYRESSEFKLEHCNDWVQHNVLPKLGPLEKRKTKVAIRKELLDFIGDDLSPRFVAYVSAYDHLVLAQIFGNMAALPPSFPHYTWDLQQKLDDMGLGKRHLPEQTGRPHFALDDARWLKKACEFLIENYDIKIPENKKRSRK